MKLYNQTKNHLRWSLSLTVYTCEPYGEVDVPDMFVEHCKARGLPLGVVPVAPEVKAGKALEEATDSAKKDEVFALQKQLGEAVASEKVAKSEVEKLLGAKAKLEQSVSGLELEAAQAKSKHTALVNDSAAQTKLLDSLAKDLEVCKQERDRAMATLEQLTKPAATPAKEDKPAKK